MQRRAICVRADRVGQVYYTHHWSALGLTVTAPTVTSDMARKLQLEKDPSARRIISVLQGRLAKDVAEARRWFEILAGKVSGTRQSKLAIVHHNELLFRLPNK